MNSIASIYIENFQSHQRTKLEPAGAGELTVIVGPTDSGKTAIIRALRWAFYNVPQGADFVRAGTTSAAVAVSFADGTRVVRERGRSFNRYRVVRPGASEQVFEGFGGEVPAEVRELTGVRPVTVGDLELALNLSEQLDGPFLGKSISAGARAKVLGKLAGTEEVDHAGRALATDLHRAGAEERRLAAALEELGARIAEYDYLPTLAEEIAALEGLLGRIRAAEERHGRLQELGNRLRGIEARIVEVGRALDRLRVLDQVEPLAAGAETGVTRGAALTRLAARRRQAAAGIETAEQALARWRELDAGVVLAAAAEAAGVRAQVLGSLRLKLRANASARRSAEAALARLAGVEQAGEAIACADAALQRGTALLATRKRYRAVLEFLGPARAAGDRWTGLERAAEIVAAAEERVAHRGTLIDLGVWARRTREELVVVENRAAELRGAVNDAERQYVDTLVQAGRCPTCGGDVDPIRLKEVV